MEHQALPFTLPNEAISHVLLNLSLKDLLSCSRVNKLFNDLTNQNFIWKNLFVKDHDGVVINHEGSWKELYKQDAPLLNLKNGRFIYRSLAKSVQMPNVNGDLERLYEFNSPIGAVLNTTVNYRGSYSPSSTLSSSFVDLKTLDHKKLKRTDKQHVKLIGNYWLFFAMEDQTAPYSSGISYREIKVYPYHATNSTPIKTLSLEWEQRTFVYGDFAGTCFAHKRAKRNEDYYTYAYTFVQFYDFAESADMMHEVNLPGELLFFSENYVGYITVKFAECTSLHLYNWRSKADLKTSSVKITAPHGQKILGVDESQGKLVVYGDGGYLTIFDPTNSEIIHDYNIEAQTKLKGAFITLVDNVCTLALKKERHTIAHAVIDIRTGHVIQTLNFGQQWGRVEPIKNEVGKFSGKMFVNCSGDVGIIDLTNPFIHEHVNVLSIPGNADSIETAELGTQVHRVSYGKLWSDLAKLCECPVFQIDSQVLIEVKHKYRYVIVFNEIATKPANKILDQFFTTCPLQHDDQCPVRGLSLDPKEPPLVKPDFGYGTRGGRFKKDTKVAPASRLKGYGTAVLLKEVWSPINGWIPSDIPKDFSLTELVQVVPDPEPVKKN